MDLLAGFFGLVVGTFIWSNIIGSLFATLPLRLKLKRAGEISSVKWLTIIAPLVLPFIILGLAYALSTPFFMGSLVASIWVFLSLGSLRKEAIENYMGSKEYKDFARSRDDELDKEITAHAGRGKAR